MKTLSIWKLTNVFVTLFQSFKRNFLLKSLKGFLKYHCRLVFFYIKLNVFLLKSVCLLNMSNMKYATVLNNLISRWFNLINMFCRYFGWPTTSVMKSRLQWCPCQYLVSSSLIKYYHPFFLIIWAFM